MTAKKSKNPATANDEKFREFKTIYKIARLIKNKLGTFTSYK